jgi:hypothetical protein
MAMRANKKKWQRRRHGNEAKEEDMAMRAKKKAWQRRKRAGDDDAVDIATFLCGQTQKNVRHSLKHTTCI